MHLKKVVSKLRELKVKSLEKFSDLLYHYAGYVYDRPYTFIFGSLFCSLILTMGFYYKEHEKDIYRLYSISNSYAYETNETINDFFYKSRKSFILIESNCNLLEPDILRELKKFEDGIKDIRVDLSEVNECNKNSNNIEEQNEAAKEVFLALSEKKNGHTKKLKSYEKKYNLNIMHDNPVEVNNELAKHKMKNVMKDSDYNGLQKNEKQKEEEEEEDLLNSSLSIKNNSMLKGNALLDRSFNIDLSDYKNDIFYPYYYIPPMLNKKDRCNLQNVFTDKKLNIDLREASEELKKQIKYGLEDICEKKNNRCNISSLFSYYEGGNAKLENPIKIDNLDFYVNRKTFKEMMFKGILGNMQYTKKGSKYIITSANAILSTIPLLGSYTFEPYVLAYEKELIDYVRFYNLDDKIINKKTNDDKSPFIRFHIFTERSLEDEVDRISKIDNLTRLLFLIGVLLIFLYALFNNVTSVLYRSKPLCAVMGIFCGFLGFLAGSGFLYFLGVKSVPPAETVPFLVIGVGVDDIFVILNSYSLLFMIKDDKKRIQICLKDSALAITVTTLTNIIAFLISAISPFYSICSFSLFTASSLFFGYVMVLTFFLSFLCIEAKLEKKKKNIFSGILNLLCSLFKKKTEQTNTVTNLQHDDDSANRPIDYENISIYEWIHNLYLFEESINKKKKNTIYLSNERSSKDPNNENMNVRENLPSIHINEKEIEKKSNEINDSIEENKGDKNKNDFGSDIYEDIQEKKSITEGYSINFKECLNNNASVHFEMCSSIEASTRNEKCIINDMENDMKNKQNCINNLCDSSSKNYMSTNNEKEKKSILHMFRKDKKEKDNICKKMKDTIEGNDEVHKIEENENFNKINSSIELTTKDTFSNMIEPNKNIYLLSSHDNALFYKYIYKEPKGNIGKYFRSIIKNYYVPFLSSKLGKTIVYFIFSFIIALSIYGCTLMKKGIKYDKVFPTDSYVRQFTSAKIKYFPHFGDLIEVYYFDKDFISKYRKLRNDTPTFSSSYLYSDKTDREMMNNPSINKNVHWEENAIQRELLNMHKNLENQDFVSSVFNGFTIFLNKNIGYMKKETPEEFYNKFVKWMKSDFLAKLFKDDFIFLNGKLVAWRFHYFQQNIDDSEISSKWLKGCKEIAKIKDYNVQMVCFHLSSIFKETDEAIIEVTLKNLGITIITILIVTAYIIKGFYSCVIIALIIFLIDLCIFGFMCLFGITVNIISMVILVLSVGFSIDHTSHIVQAFTHSLGKTRDEKMKESLHLMIGPVLHSGLSTWFVISTLFFSNKDFTVIFFQTLSLVLFFSIIFSSMFLPVLLSNFGPL
ncbi:lipid/sterol:H+ symporter, putative [Plasmodium gallinaceum]|uniref:Lipid/sterol:H+ symporter, putative n=1 Tax=Plasmodium gallinaceum TaxID=5849 RepID=A0A1J1GQL1_PLAGA|nr:lipid/sterol:H+ symporter, putative [Plasmodium gallinaceum]CRG93330.1 lipid/sterol:H+ symporter, putative [Plasmodium gallinaceum]